METVCAVFRRGAFIHIESEYYMNNKNGAFLNTKKGNFSIVSNYLLRDKNISLKAKGLYCLIQSYITLDGFILYKSFLKSKCNEGTKAFESAWSELKQSGYLIQHKNRDGNKCFYYTYELIEDPKGLRQGFVYVMENMGVYKIGRCNEKAKRIGEYTHLPDEPLYHVFEYVYDNVIVEKELHNMFKNKRRRNGDCEWFNLTNDDIEIIKNYIIEKKVDMPSRINVEKLIEIAGGK